MPAVLVLNIGTTKSYQPKDVKSYLRQFLTDPLVITLPAPFRHLLVRGIIIPARLRRICEAYRSIWTPEGSPLLVQSQAFTDALKTELKTWPVFLAMRYGEPSIAQAVKALSADWPDTLLLFNQYPQYSDATTLSSMQELHKQLQVQQAPQSMKVVEIEPFYQWDAFLDHYVSELKKLPVARGSENFDSKHFLFSFHGLPEKALKDAHPNHCLASKTCCEVSPPKNCYRSQCLMTAKLIAERAGLPSEKWSVAFQSRVGGNSWLKPYTDRVLKDLPKQGVRHLVVLAPSFTADCLETLEELGLRAKETFLESGGASFNLIQSPGASANWVRGVADSLKKIHAAKGP